MWRCGGGLDYPYSWFFFFLGVSGMREWLVGGWVLVCCWGRVECVWCGGGGAREVTVDVVVRVYIRLFMFVSSSPVST